MKRESSLERTLTFQLRACGLDWGMQTQFQFDAGRKWRADFAWPYKMLLVELEGGIYQKGGGWHQSVQRMISDKDKYNRAEVMGYHVLRFFGEDVKSGAAINMIEAVLGKARK